jgi:hypothetical protein
MSAVNIASLRARTDAKLAYAQIHLDELKGRSTSGGTDFDRAFQESFLFHLLGAKDAFLQEVNVLYGTNLEPTSLSVGKLQKLIKARGARSEELFEIHQLESEEESWLSHAKQMRDHCAHVTGVARAYHLGGKNHHKVFLKNPTTGRDVEIHVIEAFSQWLEAMRALLETLRASAVARNAA